MNIFESIRNAILRRRPPAAPAPMPRASTPGPAPTRPPVSEAPVDVEAILEGLAARNPQKLNWRTSIVDLMKLLDLDSSQANRKELARELGYAGSTEDSAAMNIWLHREVMQRLAKSGGKVPSTLH
jgi:hypothetical protein